MDDPELCLVSFSCLFGHLHFLNPLPFVFVSSIHIGQQSTVSFDVIIISNTRQCFKISKHKKRVENTTHSGLF